MVSRVVENEKENIFTEKIYHIKLCCFYKLIINYFYYKWNLFYHEIQIKSGNQHKNSGG